MSSDSSSSDEQTSRLKEAVDSSLLKDDFYKKDFAEEKNEVESKTPQSLRNQNHEVVTTNPFSLKVTPGFQKHVSQHLSKLLDKTIDDTEVFLKAKKKRKKNSDAGVRLLFTSKKFLDSAPGTDVCKPPREHRGKIDEEEIDYEARAKEVAVSSDWVLSKVEVKSWAPSFKNNVEVIQLGKKKKKKKKKLNQSCD